MTDPARPDASEFHRAPDAPEISIVIPTLNEENSLGLCLEAARRAIDQLGRPAEIIVVDGESTDRTREIAREHGARILIEPRRGYGRALMTGFENARGRLLFMADADYTYDFEEIVPIYKILLDNEADLVMGTRIKGRIEPGANPPLNRYLGTPLLSFLVRHFFRIPISDCHCGIRGFTAEAYRQMNMQSWGMAFGPEMVIKAGLAGMKVMETPVTLRKDLPGRVPHLRPWRDGWTNLKLICSYAPNYTFRWPGLILIGLGLWSLLRLTFSPTSETALFGIAVGNHAAILSGFLLVLGVQLVLISQFLRYYIPLFRLEVIAKRHARELTARARQPEFFMISGASVGLVGLLLIGATFYRWVKLGLVNPEAIPVFTFGGVFLVTGAGLIFHSLLMGSIIDDYKYRGYLS